MCKVEKFQMTHQGKMSYSNLINITSVNSEWHENKVWATTVATAAATIETLNIFAESWIPI